MDQVIQRTELKNAPLEIKLEIVSDLQKISEDDGIRSKTGDDELDVDDLSFVVAARKPDFRSFLKKIRS